MTAVDASQINISTFVEVVKRSKLVDSRKLEHALKSVAVTSGSDLSATKVAEHLIIAGLITKWQAAQLLKGKHRGFILGKYSIRRPLGRGGMSVVYEAEHTVLNTRVALKILPQSRNDMEKSVSRFLAEARAAAKLNHPNVVHVHDCDIVHNRRFMVMDLVNGSNLSEVVQRHGPLSYRNAILLLRQAALGLAHAHDNGVTHRDVKPNNFLIEKGGQLKVADMGLALFDIDIPDRHTQDGTNSVVGTVDYLAPEQAWDSRKVDRRADIYSLGCTLYFMLSGRPPFKTGTLAQRLAKHQTAAPTPLTQLRPDCPLPIWSLCQRMMAKKPQERPQRMQDIVRACDQLLPRLTGGRDIAALADFANGSGDSNDPLFRAGWASGEMLGLQVDSSSSDAANFETADCFANLPGLDSLQPSSNASTSVGHAAEPTFWAQSTLATPSASKSRRKKGANKSLMSESVYVKATVYLGLGLALAGLGLSIFKVMNIEEDERGYKPSIKSLETQDGGQVIIVSEASD